MHSRPSLLPVSDLEFSCISKWFLFSNCVRSHIDVCFKEGKYRFACVEHSCPGEYSMRLIEELLPVKDLKRLNRRIQEENIRQGMVFLQKIFVFECSLSLFFF